MSPSRGWNKTNGPAAEEGASSAATSDAAIPPCRRIGPADVAALRAYVHRGLRRAIRGLSDADLEDFTHDAVVRVLQELPRFRGDSALTTWAMAIGVRVALGALRRRRHHERRVEVDGARVESAMSEADDPGRRAEREDLVAELRRAIDRALTDRQRAAVLGEIAGTPSDVLAAQLGIARNALYKLHHDARKKLKAALAVAGFSEQDVRDELAAGRSP